MGIAKFTNNASSLLAGSLTDVATSFAITPGDGTKFPSLTGSDWFMATLVKLVAGVPTMEIIKVTARSTDTFTIVRAQEGTTALAFSAGDKVDLRVTAAVMEGKADRTGNTFTGDNTHGDNKIIQAVLKDCALAYNDNTTSNTIDYTNGSHQRWAPGTGAQTLTITNWPPSGAAGSLLIEGVNLGASTITGPSVKWINSDGTHTTTTAWNTNHGASLQASGTDFIVLFTRDAGTTIYGKVVR